MIHCQYCHKIFNKGGFGHYSVHIRDCDLNPNKQKIKNQISEKIKKYRKSLRNDFQVNCHKCHIEFTINEIASKHPTKSKYFCSRSCANSRQHSEDTKNKISKSLSGTKISEETKNKIRQKAIGRKKKNCTEPKYKYCIFCLEKFKLKFDKNQKYCSIKCRRNSEKTLTKNKSLKQYREQCKFSFSIKNYPEEFDFTILETNGFYNPITNPKGISRDHIISVKYGYENKIDPKIISHPANCRLMVHSENISKNSRSDLTLDELVSRIDRWDRKYNPLAHVG